MQFMNRSRQALPRSSVATAKVSTAPLSQHVAAPCNANGITLIETIAALVLATIISAALVDVLRSMHRQERAVVGSNTCSAWREHFVRRLRWDISNSRRMQVRPGQLRLIGYASRSTRTGEASHRPAEIVYRIEELAGRAWMTREELHLDDRANRNHHVELVAQGVARIDIVREGDDFGELDRARASRPRFYRIPTAMRCTLVGIDGVRLVECTIVRGYGNH